MSSLSVVEEGMEEKVEMRIMSLKEWAKRSVMM